MPLFHLKSVIKLEHFIAKNATAHKVNSCYTLTISYCTFCVGKHTILVPGSTDVESCKVSKKQQLLSMNAQKNVKSR